MFLLSPGQNEKLARRLEMVYNLAEIRRGIARALPLHWLAWWA
jgi:hypothetical protein